MCLFSFSLERFWSSLGLQLVAQNDREIPSLWVFVSSDILNFQIILSQSQHVTAYFDLSALFLSFMQLHHMLTVDFFGTLCLLLLLWILGWLLVILMQLWGLMRLLVHRG